MAEGRKDDTGKLRYDLIPTYPLQKLVEVYTIGAKKYTDRNWEKGLQWGRVFSAMMRHAWKWWSGEQVDQTDGQHHLASVAWCAMALMEYEQTHEELDDRPFTKNPSKQEEVTSGGEVRLCSSENLKYYKKNGYFPPCMHEPTGIPNMCKACYPVLSVRTATHS